MKSISPMYQKVSKWTSGFHVYRPPPARPQIYLNYLLCERYKIDSHGVLHHHLSPFSVPLVCLANPKAETQRNVALREVQIFSETDDVE